MAKKSIIARGLKRKKLIDKHGPLRKKLKQLIKSSNDFQVIMESQIKLAKLPVNSSPVRYSTRCSQCGRPHAVYSQFSLCRIHLREQVMLGNVPGARSRAGKTIDWRTKLSMHDPVADMLTRIRNGQQAKHQQVTMISSKMKEEVARVLQEEGYIESFSVEPLENNLKTLIIKLKYYHGRAVISLIKRISRPGLRVYKPYKKLSSIPGFGVAILSTSRGIMTHVSAKLKGVGGEVICEVA